MKCCFLHIILLCAFSVSCIDSKFTTLEVTHKNLILDNGILKYEGTPFDGRLVEFYRDSILKYEVFYKRGKKHGLERRIYENGALQSKRYYKLGFKTGQHKGWWEDSTLKFLYHFNDKGAFDGNVKEWYRTGLLFRDFNYVAGKEEGRQRLWKSDGAIKSNYEVVNGERYGLIGLKKCYAVTVNKDEVK